MQSPNELKWFEDVLIVVESLFNPTEDKDKLLSIFNFLLPGKEIYQSEVKYIVNLYFFRGL